MLCVEKLKSITNCHSNLNLIVFIVFHYFFLLYGAYKCIIGIAFFFFCFSFFVVYQSVELIDIAPFTLTEREKDVVRVTIYTYVLKKKTIKINKNILFIQRWEKKMFVYVHLRWSYVIYLQFECPAMIRNGETLKKKTASEHMQCLMF